MTTWAESYPIRVENLEDLLAGAKAPWPAIRSANRDYEALVDTGSTLFALPTRYIEQLGLKKCRDRYCCSDAQA